MSDANLYGDGWRQGSLIRATLQTVVLDSNGEVSAHAFKHDLWVLANQDCDLAHISRTDKTVLIELRPVYPRDKGQKIDGIRSKSVKLTDAFITRADSPRLTLTARALNTLKEKREDVLDENQARELKTWLGLRYDRPAVPDPCIPTARAILEFIGPLEGVNVKIRDVLVYYHEDPKEVNLFLVLRDKQDENEVTAWLDDKIANLLDQGIVVRSRYVRDSTQTPLSVLETYYSVYYAEHSLSADSPIALS